MSTARYRLLGVAIVAVAAIVRLVAASNEFWLDEIWSLRIATDLPNAWRAFTIKHDNNHILNTVYLHWLGLRDAWIVYRLPAALCGIGLVGLVLVYERDTPREAIATAALIALSYPLVLYSAEARGYAPALLAALTSFYAVEAYWQEPRPGPLLVFWIAATVGTLFHATYVPAYVALLGWSCIRAGRRYGASATAARTLAALHLLPAAVVAAFYVLFARGMVVGGGPRYRTIDVLRETAAYATGMPRAAGTVALVLVVLLAAAGLTTLPERRAARAPFFVLVLAVVPAAMLLITQPRILYFRYFLVQILFLYLLLGSCLGALGARGALGGALAAGLAALYLSAQIPPLRALLTSGRGGCVETMRYLGTHTDGAEVVVGADDEFQSPLMLWYFERFLGTGKRFRWVDRRAWAAGAPDWVLMHDLGPAAARPDAMHDGAGNRFERVAGFQCGGVARWYWWVYRRANPSGAPPGPAPSPAARPSP